MVRQVTIISSHFSSTQVARKTISLLRMSHDQKRALRVKRYCLVSRFIKRDIDPVNVLFPTFRYLRTRSKMVRNVDCVTTLYDYASSIVEFNTESEISKSYFLNIRNF